MYDKVKFWIDAAAGDTTLSAVADRLQVAKEYTDRQTGETQIIGDIDNISVQLHPNGASVICNFPKVLYNSNIYPISLKTSKEAIEKIADTLHADMSGAKVTAFEFGGNFIMNNKVSDYLRLLGGAAYYTQLEQAGGDSLYYLSRGKAQRKKAVFYDKIADAEAKGIEYPDNLQGANLLRYELRLKWRLASLLRVPQVTAETLTDEAFYSKLVQLYKDTYFSISKQKQMKIEPTKQVQTVGDAFNVFMARLISDADKSIIADYMQELKAANVFTDPKYYTRLRNRLEQVAGAAKFTESDELVKELDDAIINATSYL